MSEVICDYLNVTVPLADSGGLEDELRLYLASLGATVCQVGLWSLGGGTVKLGERGRVLTLGVSGAALQELRGMGALPEFLAIIADWPHRITRLDAALGSTWLGSGPGQARLLSAPLRSAKSA